MQVEAEKTTSLPRTLLLTRWSPLARYAGGEAIRKIVDLLPHDSLHWAYLTKSVPDAAPRMPVHRGFLPAEMHWRLRSTAFQFFHTHIVQAPRLARQVSQWAAEFRPEVLWVASDMEAISVALHLGRLLRIPVHVTVYDAFECCWIFKVPALFRIFYMRNVRLLLRGVSSLDAVSAELVEHLAGQIPDLAPRGRMVFPVSVARRTIASLPKKLCLNPGDPVRRIGFCGASRGSEAQWNTFLSCLGRLPWKFEIFAFAQMDHFHNLQTPPNVDLKLQPYAPTEADVICHFRERGVHACYLVLTKEHSQQLFARTSLSSKLTTYAAAGLPVIADVPAESVAWSLVERYGAGVRFTDNDDDTRRCLQELFGDSAVWKRMAEGADRLCSEEFALDRHVQHFQSLLRATAGMAEGRVYGI
jgi:hypothetical protein